jgi:hypothetical protein
MVEILCCKYKKVQEFKKFKESKVQEVKKFKGSKGSRV